jgi:hypothetical protein
MKEIKKALSLNKAEYYETHLSVINCILPVKMTPMEIEVIAAFMGLEGDIAQYRFGPSAKKIVMAQKKLSPAGLSNYIRYLTEKGFLTKAGDIVSILPLLIPEQTEQFYLFKFKNTG